MSEVRPASDSGRLLPSPTSSQTGRGNPLFAWFRSTWKALLREGGSPLQLALAVFMGVMVGVSPFYGLQMLLVVLIATIFRLNRLAALAAVQISIPPIYPLLVMASLQVGNLALNGDWLALSFEELPQTSSGLWTLLQDFSGVWLVGSLLVGWLLGTLAGALVLLLAVAEANSRQASAHSS